jgi:hypothetical protein
MRLIRLGQAAWQAERLYLRRSARGYAVQASFGAAAGAFGLLLLIMLHVAGFAALLPSQGPVGAALILAGIDLLLVVALAYAARHPPRDKLAEEALRLRRTALAEVADGAARAAILAPLLRSQSAKKGLIGAALTAAVVGLLSRR